MDAGGLRRLLAAAAAAEARADIFFTADTTEARRRHEDQMICDESLQKKRRDGYAAAAPLMTHCSAPQQKVRPDLAGSARLDGLQAMVQAVRSDDPAVQLEATTQFRKLLSIGRVIAGVDKPFVPATNLEVTPHRYMFKGKNTKFKGKLNYRFKSFAVASCG
ncbi:hypothetical protein EJB05_06325, partial [Eragrostis curvula]